MSYELKRKGNEAGVSLMTVVITVIVIIIIAMISLRMVSRAPGDAIYAKFAEELNGLESAIESIRTRNAANGDTEDKINAGFKKVSLKNAPGGFESFDRSGVDVTGYIIDLDSIGYENAYYGQGYDEDVHNLDTVEFLRDDIYVYDSTGAVYYARGIEYREEIVHTLSDGLGLDITSTEDGPIITNVVVTPGRLADGSETMSKAMITISVIPRYNRKVTVMVRNVVAEDQGDGTYVAQVSRNGVYTILATEVDGGRTVQKVTVNSIVEHVGAPSNLSIVVNNGSGYSNKRNGDVIVRADGATEMLIAQDSPLKPSASDDRWEPYVTNFMFDLGPVEKRTTLYAWFKDEFSNITDEIVKDSVIYDKTPPKNEKPSLIDSGPYVILTCNQTDNLASPEFLASTTEYGYRVYDGIPGDEDDFDWSTGKFIGPLESELEYEIATRVVDEAHNKRVSQSIVHLVSFDYTIAFDLQGGVGDVQMMYASTGESLVLDTIVPTKIGYEFVGWSERAEAKPTDLDVFRIGESYTPTGNVLDKTLFAIWQARDDIEYRVHHYVERADVLGGYELKLTEFLTGTAGMSATAFPKADNEFYGFVENLAHSDRLDTAMIAGDGSTELRLYYYRGKFDLKVIGENAMVVGSMLEVPFESEVPIGAMPSMGFDFDRWVIDGVPENSDLYETNFVNIDGRDSANATFKMLAQDTTLIAKTKTKEYEITYTLNRGEFSSDNPNPSIYTRLTPEFTLVNPTKRGYTFAGWIGTDISEPMLNVTVNPAKLVELKNMHYEAVFVPTKELLTISASPDKPTNTPVMVTIGCMDSPPLRIEYKIGNGGGWDVYTSAIEVKVNTTVYARAIEDNEVVDEESLVINNIDTTAPEFLDIVVSDEWEPGKNLSVNVSASDANGIFGYFVTTDNKEPDSGSYFGNGDEIVLKEGVNYIWVRDTAGNTSSQVVYVWDISVNSNKMVFAFIDHEKEMMILGEGATKSYSFGTTPYELIKKEISEVHVLEGVTTLGSNVLSDMRYTDEFSLPASLERIADDAMIYSNKFTEIEVDSGNKYFSSTTFVLYDKSKSVIYLHSDKDPNKTFTIPSTVSEIRDYAFYDNQTLSKVVSTSNPVLGDSAFELCDDLYQIEGEIGGTEIGDSAFEACKNLQSLTLSKSLESIGEAAFKDTYKLTVLELPKSIKVLGDSEASKGGIFENIGKLDENGSSKGVVRYYQSSEVCCKYATKYHYEAIFEMIDDVPAEFLGISITAPVSGVYARMTPITFVAEFDEALDVLSVPVLKIRIGEGPIKTVETAVVSDGKITYTYVAEEDDDGKLVLVSYSGVVLDTAGNETSVDTAVLGGSDITIDTRVELIEDENVYYFGTLQQAIDVARTDGGKSTISLLESLDESVVIPANKDISLDLNDFSLSTSSNGPLITNNAKLEISSFGTLSASNTIVVNNDNSILVLSSPTLEVEGSGATAITGSSSSSISINETLISAEGKVVETTGTLDVSFSTLVSQNGPALSLGGSSKATISDSDIEALNGNAVNVSSLSSADFSNGTVKASNGIGVNNSGTVSLDDEVMVTGSTAVNNSGILNVVDAYVAGKSETGYSIYNIGTVNMSGGSVVAESSVAVKNASNRFEMTGGSVTAGGWTNVAIVNDRGAEVVISNGNALAVGNDANAHVLVNAGTATILNNSVLEANVGCVVSNSGSLTISSGELCNASQMNATIYNDKGTVTVGDKSNPISTDSPIIDGLISGYFSENGVLNYYDGNFVGQVGMSISGDVTDQPENSYIDYVVTDGREKTTLIVDVTPPTDVVLTASTTAWTSLPITLFAEAKDLDAGIIAYAITNSASVPTEQEWIYLEKPERVFSRTQTDVKVSKTFYLHVKDQVGNWAVSDSVTTRFDDGFPVIDSLVRVPDSWTTGNVELVLKASDSNSGICGYEFSSGDHDPKVKGDYYVEISPSNTIEKSYTVTENGITIYVYVYDQAGNYDKEEIVVDNIDRNAPLVKVDFVEYGDTNATVRVTATDVQSGVDKIFMNGVEQKGTTEVEGGKTVLCVIENPGSISFTATDNVGNEGVETLNAYLISYDKNEGVGEMASQIKLHDVDRAIRENTFTKEGFSFGKWNDKADGSGTDYNPATDKYTANESVTLYAIWKDVLPPKVLSVKLSDSSVSKDDVKLNISGWDNVDVTHYAVTTTDSKPASWSESSDVSIVLGASRYFAWTMDATGNVSESYDIEVYDLSESANTKPVIAIVQPNGEDEFKLSIEGQGNAKDLTEDSIPWEAKADSITKVVVEEGVTEIGSKVLSGLPNVTDITISSTVTDIAIDAFTHTNNFTNVTIAGDNFVEDNGIIYDAAGENLYVASSKVTIGDVVLPDMIKEIAPYAFEDSVITGVTIPNNIDIPEGAFMNAKDLETIDAPNGVGGESIGDKAFYGTESLGEVTIAKTVLEVIGDDVFTNMGINAGNESGKGEVYYYDSCEAMAKYAEEHEGQAKFIAIDNVLPEVDSVVINDDYPVTNDRSVVVTVEASDNRDGVKIFITEDPLLVPTKDSVSWISTNGTTGDYDFTLSDGTGEKKVFVWALDTSGNVSEVSKFDVITYVVFDLELKGNSEVIQYVDTTGKDYYEYREPGFVTTGENLTMRVSGDVNHEKIGTYNVEYTASLDGDVVEELVRKVYVIPNSWGSTVGMFGDFEYVLHSDGDYAKITKWTNSTAATTLTIPNTISVGDKVYKVIDVGDGVNAISATDNKVTKVVLPENLIAVSDYAFSKFVTLSEVEYGENLMTIGRYAFANSSGTYEEFTVKSNVREVKEYAFSNSNIEAISIEDGVKFIGECAFKTYSNVTTNKTLYIPKSIDVVDIEAFAGYMASSIVVDSSNANYKTDTDNMVLMNMTGSIIYQYALGNSATTYMVPEGVTNVENGAFLLAKNLKAVTLSNTVMALEYEAFKDSNIEYVHNVGMLRYLGSNVFENTKLKEFEISVYIDTIMKCVFRNTKLTSIYIPSNVTSIASAVFADNSQLTHVVFEGTPSILGDAFKGSEKLDYMIALDKNDMITVSSALEISDTTTLYVYDEELEGRYEADTYWSTMVASDTERIKTITEMLGDKNVVLVNGAPYVEEGIRLLDLDVTTGEGAHTTVSDLAVEKVSTLDKEVVGNYTITYIVKYDGVEVTKFVRNIEVKDTIAPVVSDITTASSWTSGSALKLEVSASDNKGDDLQFAVTSSEDLNGATWSTVNDNVVTVSPGVNYISVRDESGNVVTVAVEVWDISETSGSKKVFAYEKPDFSEDALNTDKELVITGSGETTDFAGRGETPWKDDSTTIKKVTIEEGVTHLGEFVVSGLENASEISLPSTITSSDNVATNAFAGSNNYVTIDVADDHTVFKVEDKLLMSASGDRVYMSSRKTDTAELVTVTIPAGVKDISDSAFYMNDGLEKVVFSNSADLEDSAFEGCLNLTTISGEVGVDSLGDRVFADSVNLSNVTISKTVSSVGMEMFVNVVGPVKYYASCEAMREYATTYPDETVYVIIDDVGATKDKPTLKSSSSTILVTSNQKNELSTIISVEYAYRLEGEEYGSWGSSSRIFGLIADRTYFVKTRVHDSSNNVVESFEESIRTKKVPENIDIKIAPATATSGDVLAIVEWPVDEMKALYGSDNWPAQTTITKQFGVMLEGESEATWFDLTDADGAIDLATYEYLVTMNNTTVFARLYDGYNHTAGGGASYKIANIDRVAPKGGVVINGGDVEAYYNDVTITLNATDNRAGEGYGVKYYFASEKGTIDDYNAVKWLEYTGDGDYEFSFEGTTAFKKVYVWFMDTAGNVSSAVSDEIMLVTGVARLEETGEEVRYFNTLSEAFAVAKDNITDGISKVTVLRNVAKESNIVVRANKTITLDMNGWSINETSSVDSNVTTITNYGTLHVINSSMTSESTIYAKTTSGKAYGIYNRGLLEVDDVSIVAYTASGTGVGIYNELGK